MEVMDYYDLEESIGEGRTQFRGVTFIKDAYVDLYSSKRRIFDLSGSDWSQCGTDSTLGSFEGAVLRGADFREKSLQEVHECDARGANFSCCCVTRTAYEADFRGANFFSCCFSDDFRSSLERLLEIKAYRSDFRGVDARDSHFFYIKFTNSDFRGADFRNASFYLCDLSGCDMRGADFTDAHFVGSRLYECDMRGADFTDAQFVGNVKDETLFSACKTEGALGLPAELP